MADDESTAVWPLPKFYFEVKWDSNVMSFQEVSGLESETQVIEYRSGEGREFSTVKMPGLRKYRNVTLKKGLIPRDSKFWNWVYGSWANVVKRGTVTISLMDEKGAATMVWTLADAWPVKVTGTDLKSEGNEVAVESLEIAFENMTMENP